MVVTFVTFILLLSSPAHSGANLVHQEILAKVVRPECSEHPESYIKDLDVRRVSVHVQREGNYPHNCADLKMIYMVSKWRLKFYVV